VPRGGTAGLARIGNNTSWDSKRQAKSQMHKDVLESDATIVCVGGSAGTYKSETLLIDAVQEYQKPAFHGVLFRESFLELSRALIPRAHALYSQMGATYNSQDHSFHWPWGAVMRFGYLGRERGRLPAPRTALLYPGALQSRCFANNRSLRGHECEFRHLEAAIWLLSRVSTTVEKARSVQSSAYLLCHCLTDVICALRTRNQASYVPRIPTPALAHFYGASTSLSASLIMTTVTFSAPSARVKRRWRG